MIDDYEDPPMMEDGEESDLRSLLPKTLHKALVTGVSAVLMTEEGIRHALGDLRLPKEAISYVVQQTERSRKEVFLALSNEVKRYLSNIDVSAALRKALNGMRVEVRADIRFIEDGKVETAVRTTVDDSAVEKPQKRRQAKRNAKKKPKTSV